MNQHCIVVSQLAARRQSLGFPLHKIAERCGVAEKSMRDWETGGGSPPVEILENWAAALGLQLALVPVEKKPKHSVNVDWQGRRIAVDGAPVKLAPMEWKILERLAYNPGRPVSQRQLFEHLYGEYRPDGSRSAAVRVLIGRLRRKLPMAIEAQLGRGYQVNGIDPTPVAAPTASADAASATPVEAAAREPSRELPAAKPVLAAAVTLVAAPTRPAGALLATTELAVKLSGTRAAPVRPRGCRAEELGVIERFLAERGATRCPDPQTLAQSSLPTLIWDKVKRKWVRPPLPGCSAVADTPALNN